MCFNVPIYSIFFFSSDGPLIEWMNPFTFPFQVYSVKCIQILERL